VRWRGSIDSFVDCNDQKLTTRELDRYPAEVATVGASKGELFIDLRHKERAPQSAGGSN
jgi:hypothetical protein